MKRHGGGIALQLEQWMKTIAYKKWYKSKAEDDLKNYIEVKRKESCSRSRSKVSKAQSAYAGNKYEQERHSGL